MTGWQKKTLAESPVAILDGDRGAEYPKKADFFDKGDWLFLNTSNVRPDGFDFSECQFILNRKEAKLRKGRLSRDDIVLTTRGTIGNVGFYNDRVAFDRVRINSGMVLLRADSSLLLPAFLYQVVRSEEFRGQIRGLTSGAAQPQLPIRDIKHLRIPLPPINQQHHIASILGAYDDLIEVNRRRIALLEEMVRRLFEEWFVHFRFPGHEVHQLTKTLDGMLPEGWTFGTAEELIDFDPTTLVPKNGEKPFIPMSSLPTEGSLIEESEQREGNSGAKFKNGDTLFARITPCLENGKTGLVRGLPGEGVGFGSTEFVVMRGRKVGPAFTYLLARLGSFREHARRSMSGATGRQRVRIESLRAFRLGVPPQALLQQFEKFVWPQLELVGTLGVANDRLSASRDLLLPRLISGELSVSTAEKELEAVA